MNEGNGMMLIDEFVDLRVQAGESDRLVRERENVRRADERGRWLRSAAARVKAAGGRPKAVAGAVAGGAVPTAGEPRQVPDAAPASLDAVGAAKDADRPERELAHAAR